MNDEAVFLQLDAQRTAYRPGDALAGEYRLHAPRGGEFSAVELSVLWRTEGKGDEDMAVHFFLRRSALEIASATPETPWRFETVLPNSPLSYNGQIVKIHWFVRVRAFESAGRELVLDAPFSLGAARQVRRAIPRRAAVC